VVEQVTSVTQEPKYAARIENWKAFWALEDIGRPLWLIPSEPVLTAATLLIEPLPKLFTDKVTQLQTSLNILNWRELIKVDDDFVPHLEPYGGVTVFASAFGCEVEFFEHTLPWAHAVIKADDPPEKVYDLPTPKPTDAQLGQMLEFTEYFVEQTKGRYPIAMTDLQGPLDTAYLVWDSSAFMLAMYTNPKEVHHLMRVVTDLIVDYVKEQRKRSPEFIPCHYPPFYLPDGQGLQISDDGLAVISAKLYEEFCLPYVNELSEEFGGISIHSCGNFVHQFDNLEKVHNLRGLNFGASETSFDAVWERFNGKTAIMPHMGLNNSSGEIYFANTQEYMDHVLRTKTHNRGFGIIVLPVPDDHVEESGGIEGFAQRCRETVMRYA
jgi:uroporphyrinogen-III decarboxylase